MELTVGRFKRESEEAELVQKWWGVRGKGINPDFLSDFGFMAFRDATPIAACFLYPILGSRIAWIGWPIASPSATKEDRGLAMARLFDEMHRAAKALDYTWIWTTSGHPGVIEKLENTGYVRGDVGINQYWRNLWE